MREGADAGRPPRVGRPATPIVITGTTVALGPGDRRRRPGRLHRGPDRRRALRGADARACCGEIPPLPALRRPGGAGARGVRARPSRRPARDRRRRRGARAWSTSACGTLLRAPNLGWTQIADRRRDARRASACRPASSRSATRRTWRRWPSSGTASAQGLRRRSSTSPARSASAAGIVIGGELYRGSRGFAGELGHMTVRPGGAPCACGARGCLETVAGLEAIREPRRASSVPAGRRRVRDGRAARAARGGAGPGGDRGHRRGRGGARHRPRARPSTCSTSRRWCSAAPSRRSARGSCRACATRSRRRRAGVDVVDVRRARIDARRAGAGARRGGRPPARGAQPPVARERAIRAVVAGCVRRPGSEPRILHGSRCLTSVQGLISLSHPTY